MSDEKNPPDTTRPLRDELFPTAPTEPLDARGDDTLVLPASTSRAPGTEGGGTAHPADAPTTPPDGREPARRVARCGPRGTIATGPPRRRGRRDPRGDAAGGSRAGLDEPVGRQLLVDERHGAPGQPPLGGEGARRRQRGAGRIGAVRDPGADLLVQRPAEPCVAVLVGGHRVQLVQ